MQVGQIIKGHVNEALGLNKDLSEERLKICYSCPLYSAKFGGMCNNRLWLNPDTGDISIDEKYGYKRGCGCRLLAKTKVPEASCPLKKW